MLIQTNIYRIYIFWDKYVDKRHLIILHLSPEYQNVQIIRNTSNIVKFCNIKLPLLRKSRMSLHGYVLLNWA